MRCCSMLLLNHSIVVPLLATPSVPAALQAFSSLAQLPVSSEISDLRKRRTHYIMRTRGVSDIAGHAFRKRWLFIEISNMLRTDYQG